MLRRLHPEQPDHFAFSPANQAWAEAQITKFPQGRQASAIIPLLWRAQEQEGWLSRPAIQHVCDMLDMAHIRGLEVATFYFMFQLQPVGSIVNIQICGTTSCMICGAEDLVAVCKEKIAPKPHQVSEDGKFSWEEVECLGACANAPMAQIGKDYYEDLTAERFAEIIDALALGDVPTPGPQNGRFAAEPKSGLTSLSGYEETGRTSKNASVQLANDIGDTVKRIDGSEVPLLTPWLQGRESVSKATSTSNQGPMTASPEVAKASSSKAKSTAPAAKIATPESAPNTSKSTPSEPTNDSNTPTPATTMAKGDQEVGKKPAGLDVPRDGTADDLKMIKGIGPTLEKLLNSHGFFHFDQIAQWTSEEIYWADYGLAKFKGRASRDEWVAQAKLLAAGEATEFSKRAKY